MEGFQFLARRRLGALRLEASLDPPDDVAIELGRFA
jgi:hypothetical protein